jgi:cell fate (sporulation/competence/biofilm development) regulator YmcA (YheA/YmcA/DUF963 family)
MNYLINYQQLNTDELQRKEKFLNDQIDEISNVIDEVPEFSEIYYDFKRELSELKYEVQYITGLISKKLNTPQES